MAVAKRQKVEVIDLEAENPTERQNLTEKDRQEWARQMRLKFTKPDMRDEEGTLNLEKIAVRGKWTDLQKNLLIEGIAKYGVGRWQEIRSEFLQEWQEQGRQNLTAYRGWKGNLAAITAEYEKNRAIGEELGQWKGYLVADDDGKVVARLKEVDANLTV